MYFRPVDMAGNVFEFGLLRALAPSPHGWLFLPCRALRDHDIADRHFLSEAGATKTQEVAAAGCATEQIIAYQNSNKADKASGGSSASCSRCAAAGCDRRRRRRRRRRWRRRRIPSGRRGWKRCSQSESAYHRCGYSVRNIPLVVFWRLMTERLTTNDFMAESP
jgi:hypothetical protein